MKMTFYIHDKGDPSVGIWEYDAKVTIEDYQKTWDADFIQEIKENLKSTLNTEPAITEVLTEEEYNKMIEEEDKMFKEMKPNRKNAK